MPAVSGEITVTIAGCFDQTEEENGEFNTKSLTIRGGYFDQYHLLLP